MGKKNILSHYETKLLRQLEAEKVLGLEEQLLNATELVMTGSNTTDLSALYNAIGLEAWAKTVNIFSDRKVNFPNRLHVNESLIFILCFYYKEVKGMKWDKIKLKIDVPNLSTIKYGKRIKKLNNKIKKELLRVFQDYEIPEINGILECLDTTKKGSNNG